MVLPLVKRYALALNRYKWAGFAGFLTVMGISGVVAYQPPPEEQYIAEGVLDQNTPVVSFTTTGVELQQRGRANIANESFLLRRELLIAVAEELANREILVTPEQIRANTEVDFESDEESIPQIRVSYTSADEEEARGVLSFLLQGMVQLSRENNQFQLTAIIEALEERLPGIEGELRAAEQALEEYDRIEGPAIQAALDGSLLAAISGSQNQRRQNQVTLVGIEAQIQSLQQRLGLTPEGAYVSSALSSDPIVAQLRARIYEAETERQLLASDLRPGHPTMVELESNLNSYSQLLRARAQEVLSGGGQLAPLPSSEEVRLFSNLDPARSALAAELINLDTQKQALLQQQQLLQFSEVERRKEYSQLPNKQLERDRLAQQVALKRALFDQVQAKRIDAQAAQAETVSSLSGPSDLSVELVPVEETNPALVLLIGALVGVAVGGGIVYLLDMLDSTVRTYEDLDKLFENQDVPLLGLIPSMSPQRGKPALALITDPNHVCNDIYERLRSNLQISGVQVNDGKVPHTVLITSTRTLEGKTTTAFNLGIAAARAGRRTLIVEMNLRSPSQAGRLGIQPNAQAVIEPLRYYGGHLADPVQMVPTVANLYISPSAGPQRNPAVILDSNEMTRFLKQIKARFDFVILDAPDLTTCNDAMLLEPRSDGIIVVGRPDFTEKPVLTTVLEQLEDNEDVRILGAVINGAKIPVAEAQRKEDEFSISNDLPEETATKDVPVYTSVDF